MMQRTVAFAVFFCTACSVQGLSLPRRAFYEAPEESISVRDFLRQVGYEDSYTARSCNGWAHCPSMPQYGLLQDTPINQTTGVSERGFPESPKHKDLFPVDIRDVLTWLVASLTLFIAAGGGIGGGAVLVPINIMLWRFQTEHAVALSNLTIAGGACANLICNISRKHPSANRPLIDWDLILMMEPATIIGAVFGGFLNKVFPVWLTTVLLCLLLFAMSDRLWRKAKKTFDAETAQAARSEAHELVAHVISEVHVADSSSVEPLLQSEWDESNKEIVESMLANSNASTRGGATLRMHAVTSLLQSESEQVPMNAVLTLFGLFSWLLVTDSIKDIVRCGAVAYWLLVFSVVPIVVIIMTVVRRMLMHKAELKADAGLVPVVGDIHWTPRTTLTYPLLCSFAGVIAGMFGVGGGIVKGPLMLHLGVLPEVAAATSATMILFTAGSASVVYITFGGVKWDYAILMIITGFFVTLGGQMMTYHVISKLGRRSIIIIAMGVLLTVGAIIMLYEAYVAVSAIDSADEFWHMNGVCGAATGAAG